MLVVQTELVQRELANVATPNEANTDRKALDMISELR
jgi:hypothetical protein